MKKIPTLFQRDFEGSNGRYVLPEVTEGCEWVLAGEGVPTRKYDGTCVLIRRDGIAVKAFARREVKAGKQEPPGFFLIETDETTGKSVGWEPADQSGYAKYIAQALADQPAITPGTYELCGPKVQGNPEGYEANVLVDHANAQVLSDTPRDFDGLRDYLTHGFPFEGIVWHHPDGRMAKLKAKDFASPEARFIAGAEWNYEPASAERTEVVVPDWQESDPPLAWWKPLIGQTVRAVLVRYYDQRHLLFDGDGSATNKVRHGGGPDMPSKSLPMRCWRAVNPGD